MTELDRRLASLRELPRTLVAAGYVDVLATRPVLSLATTIAEDLEAMPPPLQTLVELWFLRRAVPRTRLDGAMPSRIIDDLLQLGVLVTREDTIATMDLVMLSAVGQLVLVPSPAKVPAAFFGTDVAALLVRMLSTRDSVLVLGGGPGVLAIHAAARASRVLAIEPDPIAHACAELNVAMTDATNIELRREPIDVEISEQFARVFVAGPAHALPLLPSGQDGPTLLGGVLARLPTLLRADGVAQLVGVWHGTDAGPVPPIDLEALAARGLAISATVVSRHSLAPGSSLFDAFVGGIASARRADRSAVHHASVRYLADRSVTHLYLVSMSCARGAPRVDLTRHWTLPRGEWQR